MINTLEYHLESASKLHAKCDLLYDGYPYELHLKAVHRICSKHISLIDHIDMDQLIIPVKDGTELYKFRRDVIIAACYHDVLEDCSGHMTYNDLREHLGLPSEENWAIAEIVYRCTNNKGRTRNDRANDEFYKELKEANAAVFVKLCDRLANMYYSKMMNSSMFNKYVKEYPNFKDKLYIEKYKPIFDEIETLL